jgi:LPXTG-site transpeptidase (sortase) family protein
MSTGSHPPIRPTRSRRVRRGTPLVLTALLALLLGAPALAQDARIVSTRAGEVPSMGGPRSGPTGQPPPPVVRAAGVAPVAIQIDAAQVDAEIEQLEIVDGVMQNPTGPWVVSWYKDLAGLGESGNVVMAGHIDYWNVGPAVFYTLAHIKEGAPINVTGEDGEVYAYQVEWIRNYTADDAPLDEIVGPTPRESLTLITCGGPFDYATGHYLERTVVRASRVDAVPGAAAASAPSG